MRQFCTTFALALLVTVSLSDAAFAKKDKKKKGGDDVTTEQPADMGGDEAAADGPMELTIEETGIADVDSVFASAVEPLKTLASVRESVDKLNGNVSTVLGLPAGTPFKDAINDLASKAEGKINVAVSEQGMPKLEPSDAVPENVQQAIDAVNNGVVEVMTGVKALSDLPAQFMAIKDSAMAFNPKSLMASGVKATEAPKVMKKISGNIKVVSSAPDQAKALTDSVMAMKDSLMGSFAGGAGGEPTEGETPAE